MSARHGTSLGYRIDGCRCEPCTHAATRDVKVYELRRIANGGGPLMVDPTGCRRRVRALMALGWPRRVLAVQAGYSEGGLTGLLAGRRLKVTPEFQARINDLYERLSMTPGPSERTARLAAARGWAPPLAWPDDRLDDPTYTPRDWQYQPATRHETFAELVDRGAGVSEVCRVLKLSRDSLQKWCARSGLSDDFRTVVGREFSYTENQFSEGVA